MSDTATPPSRLGQWPAMSSRATRLALRDLDALLTTWILPIAIMVLFMSLFAGAIQTGTDYILYLTPGILLTCAGFGAATTAVTVNNDMTGGIVDRFRSMDISGAPVIAGHVLVGTVRTIVTLVPVVGVALLYGFRSEATALDILSAVGIIALFIFAMAWLAASVGVLARSSEAANAFTFVVVFLPYPSSAYVPIHTMPGWLQPFAEYQPVTPVIETIRGLLLGTPVGDNPLLAIIWCVGIAAAGIVFCTVMFRRRTA
ncbi:ABC transporter permease [Actinosynnema sp. NPDC023794]